jgi:hypothetical protein
MRVHALQEVAMSISAGRPVRFSNRLCAISLATALLSGLPAAAQQRPAGGLGRSASAAPAVTRYDTRPLVFEANRGQAAASVRFAAHGRGYSLLLTDSEAVLALRKGADCPSQGNRPGAKGLACAAAGEKAAIVRMRLAGADGAGTVPTPSGEDELPGKVNYFIGNDPAKWRSGVPTYAKVRYGGIYPGVDLVFYGNQRQLEYDFVIAPGADAGRIALDLTGAESLRIDAGSGDLVIHAGDGELRLLRPATYQMVHGRRVRIQSSFRQIAADKVGFSVGAHNRGLPLVIDPMLTYATYLGGSGNDTGNAIAVDSSGSAYVTGSTNSSDFPVLDPLQSANGNATKGTAFVTKFTPDGSGLVYSSYLGGTGGDSGQGIAVDADGNAYITGTTSSSDFPTMNPLQTTNKGASSGQSTVFVAKINPAGSALVFSTYLGGSGGDSAAGIAVDPEQNIYVAGNTTSSDFPLQNPLQATNNCSGGCGGNAFVSELSSSGSALVYSTYLGGSGDNNGNSQYWVLGSGDFARGIDVDPEGEAVVAGTTYSVDFPVSSNALQPANGATFFDGNVTQVGSNGFVTKYQPGGSGYVFSTYQGGGFVQFPCGGNSWVAGDSVSAVAMDAAGSVYVTGATYGGSGTAQVLDATVGNTSPFVTGYKTDGSAYLFSTSLGGDGDGSECSLSAIAMGQCIDGGENLGPACNVVVGGGGSGSRIAVDVDGSIYVAGTAGASDFPVVNPLGSAVGGPFFLSKLHSGGPLVYSTLFGPSISGLAVDSRRNAYIVGTTTGLGTTPGAFQTAPAGGNDAYAAKITIKGTPQGIAINPPELTFGVPKNLKNRAFATSGLPVQYAVVSPQWAFPFGQASLSGTVLTPTWAGIVTIEAYQAGNETYDAAAGRVNVNVNPERLIVAAENATMTYGGAVPALTYYPISIAVNDGWVLLTGAPSLTTAASSKSPAGIYPIQAGLGTLVAELNLYDGPPYLESDPNYAFAFKNGTLTVKKAELTVAAGHHTVHQRQRIEPELTYTITGFLNGDTAKEVHGKPILITKARVNSPPGTYPIVVKQGNLSAENYKFKEVDGAITIVK